MAGYTRVRPVGGWHQYPDLTGGTLDADELEQLDQSVYELKSSAVYVEDYADNVGIGSATIDTPALQNAATAAIAAHRPLVLPPTLNLNDTTILQPSSGSQFDLNIFSSGPFTQIVWEGGSNTSVIKSYGWKRSSVHDIQIRIASGKTGVVVWDIDHDVVRGSTGVLDFYNCRVTATPTVTSCVGWRLGHTLGSELSFLNWYGCIADFGDPISGTSSGWVNEDANGLNLCWFGCAASYCTTGWTNLSTSGAAQTTGGPTMFLYGCGGSFNLTDCYFVRGGGYGIFGGRFEEGKRFVMCNAGSNVITLPIIGVTLSSYDGEAVNGRVFEYNSSGGTLTLDNVTVISGTGSPLGAQMVCLHNGGVNFGSLNVYGGAYDAVDPFYTTFSGTWAVSIVGALKMTSAGVASAGIKSRVAMAGNVALLHGSGTPEAAVAAAVGSIYQRTDGAAGTSMYVKEVGVGNTGWVAK